MQILHFGRNRKTLIFTLVTSQHGVVQESICSSLIRKPEMWTASAHLTSPFLSMDSHPKSVWAPGEQVCWPSRNRQVSLTICVPEPKSIKSYHGHFMKAWHTFVKMLFITLSELCMTQPRLTGLGWVLVICQASCFWICLMFYLPMQKSSL